MRRDRPSSEIGDFKIQYRYRFPSRRSIYDANPNSNWRSIYDANPNSNTKQSNMKRKRPNFEISRCVSDSTSSVGSTSNYVKRHRSICGSDSTSNYHLSDSEASSEGSFYDLATLGNHIRRFDTDPTIIDDLASSGAVDAREEFKKEFLTLWFKAMRELWVDSLTPANATKIVFSVIEKVDGYVTEDILQGLCRHYRLPSHASCADGFEENRCNP